MLIYAKSISGDIIPLTISSLEIWKSIHITLANIVCPDDQSRLVLLPSTCEEKDEKDEEWGLNYPWKDGDCVF